MISTRLAEKTSPMTLLSSAIPALPISGRKNVTDDTFVESHSVLLARLWGDLGLENFSGDTFGIFGLAFEVRKSWEKTSLTISQKLQPSQLNRVNFNRVNSTDYLVGEK
ncbi:MAG: hypothetical protein WC285_03120 [Candidatus Gracilibacteria bacterium]